MRKTLLSDAHRRRHPERIRSRFSGSSRRVDIQGLRAAAVLMVVAFHAGMPVPGGFIGVDVFFVISGFVITAMLGREWAVTGRIHFGKFYIRRFKRLTPALAVMIATTMTVSALVLPPVGTQETAAQTAVGAMLLAANLVIARTTGAYFDAPAETNPLLNTWSLSVEEQFYLAFPLVLAIGWWLARRTRIARFTPVVLVTVVATFSFGLSVLGSSGYTFTGGSWVTGGWLTGFYSPLTRAWEFATGALLALASAKLVVASRRIAFSLGLVGTLFLSASLLLINGATPFPGLWTLLPVIGTMLIILAGTNGSNSITRVLSAVRWPKLAIGRTRYTYGTGS